MAKLTGRRLPLSLPRRWIADLLHASRHVPAITVERTLCVAPLVAVRRLVPDPPAWVLLFTKAYAAVAARRPVLRRAYLPLPTPHLYEADESVASVAVEREFRGEPAVFFGHLRGPDRQPLAQLARHLHDWRTLPVERVRPFHRLVRYTRLPRPLRRAAWWYAANLSGESRAKTFGTFGVSVTAGNGAAALNLVSPLATTVSYGLIAADGTLPVRVHFDHRVMDGAPVARALVDLEDELNGAVLDELRAMTPRRVEWAVAA